MNDLKLIADILASLASFIAIVAALVAWYRSARKPIAIDRVVIHTKDDSSRFILILKNRKSYPVTLKKVDCHIHPQITVQQKPGELPEHQELLNLADRLLHATPDTELAPFAHTDVKLDSGPVTITTSKLLFTLDTSHGFHQLWCSNILVVPIGVSETYTLDFKREYHSRIRAKLFYWWARVRDFIGLRIKQ